MAIQLLTQNDVRQARERVKFCYLCGSLLDSGRGKKSLSEEHVVPRSLLRLDDSVPIPDRFPVILDTHLKCDAESKSKNDNVVAAFHSLHSIPQEKWGKRRLNQIKAMIREEVRDEYGQLLPLIDAQQIVSAGIDWVRGMHALLYNSFLPSRRDMHFVDTPLPGMMSKHRSGDLITYDELALNNQEVDQHRWVLDSVISKARARGILDSVEAWGGKLKYECVWLNYVTPKLRASKKNTLRASCFWSLHHPGIEEVVKEVDGGRSSWSGMYLYYQAPDVVWDYSDFVSQPNKPSLS